MTPAEHVTAAEQALDQAADMTNMWDQAERVAIALTGVGHALIALAVEQGAPHASAPPGGPASG